MSQRNRDDVVVGAKDFSPHSPTPAEALPEGFKMTELGPLPEEWQVVALGSLAEVSAGGSAPQGHRYFGSSYPFVRVQHLDENGYEIRRCDYINDKAVHDYHLRLFPRGTIVFPKSGASIRLEKRGILIWDSYLVSHLCAVIPNERIAYGEFLFFVLKSIRFSSDKAEGYPTLSLTEIKQRLIPLPPLPEQRAIAHVLRTVQEAQEATERVITALKELKKSLMRHLFSYGPVPPDRTDQVELQETELGPLPAEWQVVRLGEVATSFSGIWGCDPASNHGDTLEKVRIIRVSDITADSKILFYRAPLRMVTHKQAKKYMLRYGDIIVVKSSGSKTKVISGRCAYFGFSSGQDIFLPSNFTLALRCDETRAIGLFLWFYLLTDQAQEAVHRMTEGSTYPNLKQSEYMNLPIPLPPLPEQREIARILQAVDAKIAAEEQRKEVLEGLFKSLLAELMSGRVRLPPAFVRRFVEEKS